MNILEKKFSINNGNEIFTHLDIQRRIDQYKSQLPKESKTIGLAIDNSIDWLIFDLLAHQDNLIVIPIPAFFSQNQLEHLFSVVKIDLLVTNDMRLPENFGFTFKAELAPNILLSIIQHDHIINESGYQKITFTSGTTGNPKGVCLSTKYQFEVAYDLAEILQDIGIKKHLSVLPFSILLENVAGTYTSILLEGENYILPLAAVGFNGVHFNPAILVEAIQKYKIESMILLPQMLTELIHFLHETKMTLASLKFIAVGGAKTPVELIEEAKNIGLPVYEGYGLSECASVVSVNTPHQEHIGSVGKILNNRQIRVIDNEIEVYLNEGLQYLNQDFQNPDWYPTGDIGYIEDGFLFINGRKKNILITSYGRNISPEWPESILLSNKKIKQAMVTCIDEPFLTALIFADEENYQAIEADIEKVNNMLPEYARIESVYFMSTPFSLNNGMMTANGRIKRDYVMDIFKQKILQERTEIA
jgi:long-chain acyl-CoA synthetase